MFRHTEMVDLKLMLILIIAVCLKLALTITSTWIQSMEICGVLKQRASTEEDIVKNNTWIGKAKYVLDNGTIILQIQRVENSQTCSDCPSGTRCEFCAGHIQLIDSISSLKAFLRNSTPEQKYIIGDFTTKSITEIPPPTACMVHRGAMDKQFVFCNDSFEDGCKSLESQEKQSELKITIYFFDASFTESSSDERKRFVNGSTKPERLKVIWLLISAILIPCLLPKCWVIR